MQKQSGVTKAIPRSCSCQLNLCNWLVLTEPSFVFINQW